jgi:DegV family protein with EDD domain
MPRMALYTDNGCDLDKDVLENNGVKSFYMSTLINGQIYADRLTINPPEFYSLLEEPGVMPTTAQVNIADLLAEFSRVMQQPDTELIYISFSGGLSGTYQTACMARDMVNAERITIVDSRSASVGQGLIVLRAARAVAAGKSKAEVLVEIDDSIRRMQAIFIVGNLEMLSRGGRINPAAAMIGDLLSIKLILQIVDGKIEPLERAYGLKKAKKRLLEIMEQRAHDLQYQTIGLAYSKDLEGALEIKRLVMEKFRTTNFVVSEIGALIGSHVGPNTFGLLFLRH